MANAEQHGRDMSAKENKRSWKFAFIGAGIGAVFGAIVTLIINNWDKIICMFYMQI